MKNGISTKADIFLAMGAIIALCSDHIIFAGIYILAGFLMKFWPDEWEL